MGKYTYSQTVHAFRITRISLLETERGSEHYQIEGDKEMQGEKTYIKEKDWMDQNNVQVGDWFVFEAGENILTPADYKCIKPEDFVKNYYVHDTYDTLKQRPTTYYCLRYCEVFRIKAIHLTLDGMVFIEFEDQKPFFTFTKEWMGKNNVQVGGYIAYEVGRASTQIPPEEMHKTKYEYIPEKDFLYKKKFIPYAEVKDLVEA